MDPSLNKETREPLSAGKTNGLTVGKIKAFFWGKIKKYLMQSYARFSKPWQLQRRKYKIPKMLP